MSRNVVITSIGSHTGGQIAKLLLSDGHFKRKVSSVTGLTLYPEIDSVKEVADLGAKIVEHKPGNLDEVVATLKETGADAILLLPPGHKDSYNITLELIEATKKANIPNVCFISSVGCDLAERDKQPLLRSVIDLEAKVLEAKGDASTETGHSPVIIRCVNRYDLLFLAVGANECHIADGASTRRTCCCTPSRRRRRESYQSPLGKITSLRRCLWVYVCRHSIFPIPNSL
jgi:hypothetical protein